MEVVKKYLFIISLHKKTEMAVLWGLRPSAPVKAFTTLRVRVRINQKCIFLFTFLVAVEGEGNIVNIFYEDNVEYKVYLLNEKAEEVEKNLKNKLNIK